MNEKKEMIDNAIFDFVYHEALNDATLQKAYSGNKREIEQITKARNAVKEYIDGIFSNDKKPNFRETVLAVRKALNEKNISDKDFTFGNIQKLINMTAKYFYISCYKNEDFSKNFNDCHCPMDSIMIKKARGLLEKDVSRKDLKSTTSWSKIVYKENDKEYPKEYEVFQDAILEACNNRNISPIEFDYLEWQESNNKKKTND